MSQETETKDAKVQRVRDRLQGVVLMKLSEPEAIQHKVKYGAETGYLVAIVLEAVAEVIVEETSG